MWPLTKQTQAELGQRVNAALENKRDAIVAVWDPETCFFMACHVHRGAVAYVECCGPISEDQADKTAAQLGVPASGVRPLESATTH